MTPAQIANWKEENEGDTELVDGYDELSVASKAKVDYALEHGHVADEDWKGVSVLPIWNRATLISTGCGSQSTRPKGVPCQSIQSQGSEEEGRRGTNALIFAHLPC